MTPQEIFREITKLEASDVFLLREELESLTRSYERLDSQAKTREAKQERRFSKQAQQILLDSNVELTGPEAALLGCLIVTVKKEKLKFTSRDVSSELEDDREPSNITTTLVSLTRQGYIIADQDGSQSHKQYELTKIGRTAAENLIDSVRTELEGLSLHEPEMPRLAS